MTNKRLWVGGVRFAVTAEDLQREFEHFGIVEEIETGFIGVAFVTFKNDGVAEKCLEDLDAGKEVFLAGRRVGARMATEKCYEEALKKKENKGHRVLPRESRETRDPSRHASRERRASRDSPARATPWRDPVGAVRDNEREPIARKAATPAGAAPGFKMEWNRNAKSGGRTAKSGSRRSRSRSRSSRPAVARGSPARRRQSSSGSRARSRSRSKSASGASRSSSISSRDLLPQPGAAAPPPAEAKPTSAPKPAAKEPAPAKAKRAKQQPKPEPQAKAPVELKEPARNTVRLSPAPAAKKLSPVRKPPSPAPKSPSPAPERREPSPSEVAPETPVPTPVAAASPQQLALPTATPAPASLPAASPPPPAAVAAAAPVAPAPAVAENKEAIIDVSLSYKGRKKRVRHLESTEVGKLAELHLKQETKPIIILDSQGFEIGRELTLGVLFRQAGMTAGSLLELEMQVDDW